jgi:ADP-ribose pyrophosphatase YjhB (NUDIX family)
MFFQKKYGLETAAYATLGGLFNEGENAVQCATRELEEETGLVAGELVSLGKVSECVRVCVCVCVCK